MISRFVSTVRDCGPPAASFLLLLSAHPLSAQGNTAPVATDDVLLATVTVPASLVGHGYKIRINAHTAWVSRTTLGNVNVEIANAIEHPYFDLNQHTDADWLNGLRNKPAPYAVFVSDHMMFCQRPSESATLTTPTALMTWWGKMVSDQDWLGGRLLTRVSAEFTNVDVQNSAGAAHSGYPVQGYDKYWGNLADSTSLAKSGSWGDFHELGHNHQRGWWNCGPDGEVKAFPGRHKRGEVTGFLPSHVPPPRSA
ncbi:MAG: M60 family metallopeptidase [Akkermansiaceae bacterium]|nr:M60 family metallopeptidase [Akkermansiaceae bacterium]MCF7732421.1 M60 family metallopeptidase [Akkermansiaceae bacterium]